MKNYLVVLTLVGGMTFTQKAEGRCVDDALVDAFYHIKTAHFDQITGFIQCVNMVLREVL